MKAAGGFDAVEMPESTDALADCTDDLYTPCVPADREHPWLLYDLGQEHDIHAVVIKILYDAPPSPPAIPPSSPPSPPPTPPPPSPRSPPPSPYHPSPHSPPTLPPVHCSLVNNNDCVINNVYHFNNGLCEDGAPSTTGVPNSEEAVCPYGSDTVDCGIRECSTEFQSPSASAAGRALQSFGEHIELDSAPHPPQEPWGYFSSGWLEVWVSRHIALFGTRCATLNTTSMTDRSITLRCTEGAFSDAQGRYVYVRSFESARMLRIDGVSIYSTSNESSASRRLEQLPAPVPEHKPTGDFDETILLKQARKLNFNEKEEKVKLKSKKVDRMQKLVNNMLNLTETVCELAAHDPAAAANTRRDAAILWAELDEEASGRACFDCVTHMPQNCTYWFAHRFSFSLHAAHKRERLRQLRDGLEEQKEERLRGIEEGLGRACCRRNKLTGEKDCHKSYCQSAFRQKGYARLGHTMRRMHEKGHVELDVSQQVAVDALAPHIHSDPRCRAKDMHSPRKDPSITEAECLTSSVLTHIAAKHGISTQRVDEELGKYGLSMAKLLAQPLKVTASASETMRNFKSDPKFAEMAAKVRERERKLKESKESKRRMRQTTHPRGRALKAARHATAELAERAQSGKKSGKQRQGESVFLLPAPLRQTPTRRRTSTQTVKKNVRSYLKNASRFSSGMLGHLDNQRSLSTMPVVHAAKPPGLLEQSNDVVAAVVSSDGSILNRATQSAARFGNLLQRGSELVSKVRRRSDEKLAEHAAQKQERARRLSESEVSSFYDQVEERLRLKMEAREAKSPASGRKLAAAEVGFTTPDEHLKEYGWISELTDWRQLWKDTQHAARVLVERHDHVLDHVERTGFLTQGELREEHKTGVPWLDLNVPPSRLGNKLRQLHALMSGKHKTEEHRDNHRRRMQAATDAPRRQEEGQRQSTLASIIEAGVVGQDPIQAAIRSLESSNHHRGSTARRLADSFLGEAAALPIVAGSFTSNRYASYENTNNNNFLQDTLRYLIYDTVCTGSMQCHHFSRLTCSCCSRWH